MDSIINVNIPNIIHNIQNLTKGKQACLMVKADGYGLGMGLIKNLINHGYNYFGVSNYSEALMIREIDPNCDILIVTKVPTSLYNECISKNFSVSIIDFNGLDNVIDGLKFHIKLDTGMNRIGFKPYEFDLLVDKINNTKYKAEGIFTHLSCADNVEFSNNQIELFYSVVDRLNYTPNLIHYQNTIGCILYDDDRTTMVRPGIGIYGLYSSVEDCTKFGDKLKLGFTLSAFVIQSKQSEGYVGYDATEFFDGYISTLKLGYHDGWLRKLSGYNYTPKHRILGKICMCQHMVTGKIETPYFNVIDTKEDIYNIAKYCDITIYELIVGMSNRLERRYYE